MTMYRVLQNACLILYIAQYVLLIQCTDLTDQHLTSDLTSDRDKRETDDEFGADDVAKRSRELVGKRSIEDGLDETTLEKRLMPYDELEKRLRHFIGKRTDDNEQYDKKARSRYFVGKREDDEDEQEKRGMRYFLGKREDDDIDEEKRGMRYFLGKRDSNDLMKRRYYFLGKRPAMTDNDIEKRRRFFLGKRRRFFLGKRDSAYNDYAPISGAFGEGADFGDVTQNGLRDFIQKRMRYFLGKRSGESDVQNMETDKRFARHFLGR